MKGQKVVFSQSGQLMEASEVVRWRFAFFVVQFKQVLPKEWLDIIEAKSGLPFPYFVGQVVQWWFHHRRSVGLYALAERSVTHAAQAFSPLEYRPSFDRFFHGATTIYSNYFNNYALHTGSDALQVIWYLDQIFVLLCGALGFVGGSVYRRSHRWWFCGDHLCRARVKTSKCRFCGCEVSL